MSFLSLDFDSFLVRRRVVGVLSTTKVASEFVSIPRKIRIQNKIKVEGRKENPKEERVPAPRLGPDLHRLA
jgi:hypothetical protein